MASSKKSKFIVLCVSLLVFILILGAALSEDTSNSGSHAVRKFPVNEVELLAGNERVQAKALFQSEYQLVNVWASWCSICRAEHDFLNQLSEQGIAVIGLNYRDQAKAANQYLAQLGDPYQTVIYDPQGELSIDLGVVGTPETYLINQAGEIVYKHSGLLNPNIWKEQFARFFTEEKS
ncbi:MULTISPECIES: DsbE family thiol:disulfide interchange protein [unclassified Vibrio]|uniref:DsbE family thiol:disulfide interchange protein n=1 Tax=unclassified Vibrio TaxID=2614977 RepID=UPI001268742F|nr:MULTISPECIES: DsbE family thiol:disulfide interchange protein [unclassified Vibrio]MCM5510867.1 DsbE family thiol:disulfide interchange protein [Vibrio sp. SCSIO 43169]QFT35617.1 Thiol:disulfide interchange protein DsbE [Vibrio sp. THAF64]QGM33516.1 Thiol:disulfide interchange protein DsbE [Vibrio sp. THAF191d]QGN69018.1 Thiol:disulfide interchange protein DsbE [Vibrio sp. THAF191c]